MFKYVLERIYTHYHGGYVFIQFGNFKRAYYMKCIYTLIFPFFLERICRYANFLAFVHACKNLRICLSCFVNIAPADTQFLFLFFIPNPITSNKSSQSY